MRLASWRRSSSLLACAAPAQAAETGVNETLGHTVSIAAGRRQARRRLGPRCGRCGRTWSPRPGSTTQHLIDELNAEGSPR